MTCVKWVKLYTCWGIMTEEELSFKMYFFKIFISDHHKYT
jgi:hypothetical protein